MDRDLVRRWLREVLQPVRETYRDAAALTTQYLEQGLIFVDVEAVLDEVPTLLPRTDVYSMCAPQSRLAHPQRTMMAARSYYCASQARYPSHTAGRCTTSRLIFGFPNTFRGNRPSSTSSLRGRCLCAAVPTWIRVGV